MVISLVLGVLGSIIAAALFPGLQAAAIQGIIRVAGWLPLRQPALFSGTWHVVWEVESPRYEREQVDPSVQLRQLGRRVFATVRAKQAQFDITGIIDGGRYVTGTWRDRTEGGYHGAFQLVVDPSTRDMRGTWIGYSTGGSVKSGRFLWTRNSRKDDSRPAV